MSINTTNTSAVTIVNSTNAVTALRPQVDYLKMRRARQDAMSQKPLPINDLVADVIARQNQLYHELNSTTTTTTSTNISTNSFIDSTDCTTTKVTEAKLSKYKHDAAVRSNVEKMRAFLL